ncbi:MAG TPA: class I SAM-dependent methyltransferase [Candidatus Acidoferrum sp.]|nr:class I SAM-dependent methyltransferase [Candidatus Acidoferrum sp.]
MQPTKGYKGMGMEGAVARWYERNTRRSMPEFKSLAQRMAGTLAPGARVLEVAPGPGFFAIELAQLGNFEITGLDISATFVEIARGNAEREGVHVDFQQGNASNLPFPADRFHLVLCRAAFKNFSDPVGALREMRRVLKPGGRAVVIDLRKDVDTAELDRYIHALNAGALNAFIMKWTFRLMLIKRAYTREQFEQFIAQSGFEKSDIQANPVGYEITLSKCREQDQVA